MKSTVKSSVEVSRFFTDGKKAVTPYVTIFLIERSQYDHPRGRTCVMAGKKLGNAVTRNRAKRRMRALISDLGGPWPGYDVAFLARNRVLTANHEEMCNACKKALAKVGIQ
ncbi:ribonuclease P protein component [Slackia heliotrinireducens]|uniref:ribonuclease P protein component n=1 Tax=Slackia heliotrinireducens TaxID=84110 RepID=UPI000A05A694|nr:ribonuclease P protein component [Slackia heliotrinireducens]